MKQNNYTANDIERYHSGGLSAAEMHLMEKAALDDPFLADALEGYSFTQNAAGDLASLQQKLQIRIQKEESKKRIFYIGSNWMKIAALFILFVGGGWLVFQMLPDKKNEVATNTVPGKQSPKTTTETRTDSTQVFSDAPIENQTVAKETDLKTEKKETEKNLDAQNSTTVSTSRADKESPISPSTTSQPVQETKQDQSEYLQDVTVMQKQAANDSLSFKSKANSEAVAMNRKLSGRVPGVTTDTIKNLNVVLQKSEVFDEIIVLNRNRTVARQNAKRSLQVTVDTLEPAKGWKNFGDYMANNMRSPEELTDEDIDGEVELSFEVNKQGMAMNITVVKSLCEKCDEEAVRVLKEGPKWKMNNKKGTVKIKF